MPLIRIDLLEGRSDAELRAILDATQDAARECFEVPANDRYQIVTEHKPGRMVLLDTGLGIQRSGQAIVVQVFTSPRTTEMKRKFYATLADKFERQCGLAPSDLIISINTNEKADWSFGNGRAQYLTGEL